MKVKICGITTLDDTRAAIDAGADLLGFNFYPKSPRYIEPAACAELVKRLPRGRRTGDAGRGLRQCCSRSRGRLPERLQP